MNPKVAFWTPIVSLLLPCAFLIVSTIRKQKPSLANLVGLFLSGYGATSSLYLGYTALFLPLGPVKDQKTALIIGAMAVIYVASDTSYKIFTQDTS